MYQAFIISYLLTDIYMYILLYNVCRTKADTKIITYDANTVSDNIYKFEQYSWMKNLSIKCYC